LLDNEQFMEWYQQFQPRATASLPPNITLPIRPPVQRIPATMASFPTNRSAGRHP
jgi:hypothetical protein